MKVGQLSQILMQTLLSGLGFVPDRNNCPSLCHPRCARAALTCSRCRCCWKKDTSQRPLIFRAVSLLGGRRTQRQLFTLQPPSWISETESSTRLLYSEGHRGFQKPFPSQRLYRFKMLKENRTYTHHRYCFSR